jgi:internalin A
MRYALIAMLAVVIMAGSGWADEADAVKLVEKLGGKITRDERLAGKPVVGVTLDGCDVTDSNLKTLKELKQLRQLDLDHTKVTDAGLKELTALKQLLELELSRTAKRFTLLFCEYHRG